MWLAIHDGAITLGVSLHKLSFVVGEHEIQPSGTRYHPNCHWRWKILLILRNLNKQQVINTKNTVFSGKTRHSSRNLSQKNLSNP